MNDVALAALEALLPWSTPREVPTKRGLRILRKAKPSEAFWNAWRAGKDQLRAHGIGVAKSEFAGGDWEVTWWREIPREIQAARAEVVEMSRATDAEIDVPCPDGLAYMPFQRAGIRFGTSRPATLIADEMGLGKTIQALGVCNAHPEAQNILIITKASLKMNWWREARKWLVNKSLSIGIVEGKVFPSADVIIINFDLCHKFERRLTDRNWDVCIIDEVHNCKTAKARRTKAILGYKPKRDEPAELASSGIPAKVKLALTGTPIENRLEEMWTVLWWLDRERFPSKWKLLSLAGAKYVQGIGQQPATADGLANLQRYLRETVMIRRLKKDVLTELPPKTRTVIEFTGEEFASLVRDERDMWEKGEEERIAAQAEAEVAKASDNAEDYTKAIAKLRAVQGVAFAEMARVRCQTAVAKIPKMIEHLRMREEEVGKMLVFAHHTEVLETLGREFAGECVVVHGGHSQSQRDERVHRFMTDPTCTKFFGSIRATGEGLNLTAASHVIFHESDWVPSKMVQCEDRAHRIGQRDNVTVEVCIVDGTIDAKMAKTCVEKANLADRALDEMTKREVLEDAPVVVDWKPLATKRDLESSQLLVTEAQRQAVLKALGMLAGSCDGARKIDGAGFSKMDAAIGRSLANRGWLSDKQVVLGARLVIRYQRQLPSDLVEQARGLMPKTNGTE